MKKILAIALLTGAALISGCSNDETSELIQAGTSILTAVCCIVTTL